MRIRLVVVFVFLFISFAAVAQQSSPAPAASSQASATLPDDISGMYSFEKEGEFVQVTVEDSGVSGFISRYGDSEADKGTFLDQFFDKASLKDNHLTFTTKKTHGVSFAFDGTVEKVSGKTSHDEGYRVIRGTLTQTYEDASGKPVSKSRHIEMKSFPQDLDKDEESKKP